MQKTSLTLDKKTKQFDIWNSISCQHTGVTYRLLKIVRLFGPPCIYVLTSSTVGYTYNADVIDVGAAGKKQFQAVGVVPLCGHV